MPQYRMPVPRGREQVALEARGIVSESQQLEISSSAFTLISQSLYGELVGLRAGDQITKIGCFVSTGGSALTLVKVAIYDTSGTQLASSSTNHTNFGTNGVVVDTSLSATYSVPTTGAYYLAILAVGSTGPTLRANGLASANLFGGSFNSGVRSSAVQTSQSDLPGTATFAAGTQQPLYLVAEGTAAV